VIVCRFIRHAGPIEMVHQLFSLSQSRSSTVLLPDIVPLLEQFEDFGVVEGVAPRADGRKETWISAEGFKSAVDFRTDFGLNRVFTHPVHVLRAI